MRPGRGPAPRPDRPSERTIDPDRVDQFGRERLRERLRFYDLQRELALYTHHPVADEREAARERMARVLSGHNHLDGLSW